VTTSEELGTEQASKIVVIGAGPAGLTAAYVLAKRGVTSTVLESDTVVGGISRTAERDGWRFDIGGHRFFTKVKPVEDLGSRSSVPTTSFVARVSAASTTAAGSTTTRSSR
jgi:protoporphyrinogen oxidase